MNPRPCWNVLGVRRKQGPFRLAESCDSGPWILAKPSNDSRQPRGAATSSMARGVSSLGEWRSSQIRAGTSVRKRTGQSAVDSRQSSITVFSPSRQSESPVASRAVGESPVGVGSRRVGSRSPEPRSESRAGGQNLSLERAEPPPAGRPRRRAADRPDLAAAGPNLGASTSACRRRRAPARQCSGAETAAVECVRGLSTELRERQLAPSRLTELRLATRTGDSDWRLGLATRTGDSDWRLGLATRTATRLATRLTSTALD